jgi:hypothetical protein
MQELLRHSTIRVTLDTYTQAVTTEKRKAQEAVVALLFPGKNARKVSSFQTDSHRVYPFRGFLCLPRDGAYSVIV